MGYDKEMKHLKTNNISYTKHLIRALFNSFKLLLASIILFIHSVLPFLFENTATKLVKQVLDSLKPK